MTALISGRVTRTAADLANIRQFPSANAPDVGDLRVGDAVQFDPTPVVGGFYFVLGARFNTWLRLANGYVAERIVTLTADSAVPPPVPPAYLNGVDISQAQTRLDWDVLKANGYSFALIRASQGTATSRPVGVDIRFHDHINAALAAGFRVGVYHNHLPDADGAKQAEFYYATIAPYLERLSFPPAVDVETDNGFSKRRITDTLYALVRTLEPLIAQQAMVYTSPGFWDEYLLSDYDAYFAQRSLWVAHWGDMAAPLLPRPWRNAGKSWTVWQWQVDENGVPGYSKRIDVDRVKP